MTYFELQTNAMCFTCRKKSESGSNPESSIVWAKSHVCVNRGHEVAVVFKNRVVDNEKATHDREARNARPKEWERAHEIRNYKI